MACAYALASTVLTALALSTLAPAQARAAEQQAYSAAMNYATPTVTVGQGDTLTLNNFDTLAKHDLVGHDGGFGSDLIGGGQSGPVRGVEKLTPGQYPFHCTLHGWMKGVLNVGPAGAGPGAPSIQGGGGTGTGSTTPDPIDIWPQATPEPIGDAAWPFYGRDLANSRNGGAQGPAPTDVPNLGPAWSFHSHHGDFTATPVVAENVLVAGSNGGYVYGLDATTGKQLWQYKAGPPINGSAAIAKGVAYVPVAQPHTPHMLALDLHTGKLIWEAPLSDQPNSDVYGSPVVWRGRVFMGTSAEYGELNDPKVSTRGTVVALGAKRGRLLWRTFAVPEGHDGGAVWTTPAIDRASGRLYVGTGNAYHEPAADTTDSLLAIDARDGRLLGHHQATAGDNWNGSEAAGTDYDFGASPNLIEGPLGQKLVGMGQKSGTYWAWDRDSLKPAWQATAAPGTPVVGGIVGSTAYDGTRVYGPSTTGGEEWSVDRSGTLSWVSSDGGPLHFNPTTVANGVVYTTDMSGFLTAREAMTGAPLVKIPLGSPTWGGVSVAGGSVFAAIGTQGDAGYIVSYRVRRGDELSQGANRWEEEPAPEYAHKAGERPKKLTRTKTKAKNRKVKERKKKKRKHRRRRGGRGHQDGRNTAGDPPSEDGQGEGDEPIDPEEEEDDEGHHGGGTGGGATKAVRERADRYVPKPPGTTQHLNLYYGPYTIPPGWDANRVDLDLPTTDGWLLSVEPVMYRATDLSEPSHQEAHIHHAHWFGADPGNKEDNYLHGTAEWIFGMGDEGTRGDFRERSAADPDGPVYGAFIRKGQEQTLIYMLHNKTAEPMEVYIALKAVFQSGTRAELEKLTGRPYHDVAGALMGRTYNVPRRPDGDGTYQYARDSGRTIEWTAPEDGTMIGAGGHLHPGGLRVVAENYGSTEHACPNDGRGYGGTLLLNSDVLSRKAPLSEDYQTEVTHPAWRAPVHKGDRIRISGTYENRDHAWYTVMTHMGMYFDKAQKPGKRHCKPYMIADKKWDPTEGVPNRSWGHHTDEFCGEEWGEPACEHPDQGPPAPEVRTNLVKILNFAYLPGDRAASGQIASVPVIKQGQRLTFVNDDQSANIRHSVTTCASPCNGKYVANYPLADGRWDSGILGFDLIDGGSPNPVAQTPPDLARGQYRYFCRIHPWMRGEFKVE